MNPLKIIDEWARKDVEYELSVEQVGRTRISALASGGWLKSAGIGIAILIVNEFLFSMGMPSLPVDAMVVVGVIPLAIYAWRYFLLRRAIRASNIEKTFE